MKNLLPVILLLFSCNPVSSPNPDEYKLTICDQDKYDLIWNMNMADPEWKIKYLEYVGSCLEDTTLAKQLALLEAESGSYSILVYGLLETITPYENIYSKYPISFYNPGCVSSNMGEYYNQQVRKLIKKDLGIDYDSLVRAEFLAYEMDQEEDSL